ncbi:MCE family protein [Mycolicibacterium fluoranthenivorans]|uniref:MCE family protein n=1 Tax=Mycolicibacterium fluoranthenivorans TaxID=258505 RepID=A0A7G8PGD2_9MYCO|nr:MCE family protein [Mycolicibacterium fluoranthenivorans]QNJ93398.1 MCE family protein [Mycolicibacterium fluoranthenivorans]
MKRKIGDNVVSPRWWALLLVASMVGGLWLTWALYNREFSPKAVVSLTSERSGLMMEPGNAVKMRGVEVGRVAALSGGSGPVTLTLNLNPDQLKFIPSNVEVRITASTAFGPKYVDFTAPQHPSATHLAPGAVLQSRNVSTEVNTVFDNLVDLLHQVDPAKLNGILTTLAEGLRGRGEQIGRAISASSEVLGTLNANSDTIRQDFRSLKGFTDAYGTAAPALLSTLDSLTTTSQTINAGAKQLDGLLLSVTGLANTGNDFLGANKDKLVDAVNILNPTTTLLYKYNPEYTCLLVGARWYLDHGIYDATGGQNGYSLITDTALLLGKDPYKYPDNLPIVAAKGGPGGKPSCGSLPDASKNSPVRSLVTNTGWGTGIDQRPNIGLAHPCFANYFPVTRAAPESPTYRCVGPPSPGLVLPPAPPSAMAAPVPPSPPLDPSIPPPPVGAPAP